MVVLVGIALGSNLGDRSAELDAGDRVSPHPRARTAACRNRPGSRPSPVNCPPGSPLFLNSVAEIQIDSVVFPPLNLFACLEDFEIERGRSPLRDFNAPRPLDLDIIYYGNEKFHHMGLIIPHPRAHVRRFVLEPLSHLHPDLVLPGQTKTVSELLKDVVEDERLAWKH